MTTSSSTSVDRGRVEIRYSGTQAALAVVLAALAIAGAMITEDPRSTSIWDAMSRDNPWFGWFCVIALAIMAVFCLWHSIDRRPVLLLDATGICDLRHGSVVLPWRSLERAVSSYWGVVALQFDHDLGIRQGFQYAPFSTVVTYAQSTATFYLAVLDISPQDFLDQVRRRAPHAAVG